LVFMESFLDLFFQSDHIEKPNDKKCLRKILHCRQQCFIQLWTSTWCDFVTQLSLRTCWNSFSEDYRINRQCRKERKKKRIV